MAAEVKNVKHCSINICSAKFIFTAFFLVSFFSIAFSSTDEKTWVIVIDPGHGGRDPGALGSFSRESDLNLAIALKTGKYIEESIENVKVIYTRKTDKTVDLRERPIIANNNKADLFISIHTNWAKSPAVSGAETYIMGITKDEENLAVAMRENEVIYLEDDFSTKYQNFDPKQPESYIIFTLMQNVYQKQSTNFASMIQTQFTERVSRKDRGVKQAGYWVLFNTAMPCVLIETGFISNVAEEKFLNSEQGQDYMASAIFRACRDYINDIKLRSNAIANNRNDSADTSLPELVTTNQRQVNFRVQVASSTIRKEMKPENFKGIKDIIELESGGRYKYLTGNFEEYDDALVYRKEINRLYPDAFIIALKNDTLVSLQQALKINRKNK
ncbi:MAG TPA: N-acetylmuramoyl-L-alanine amidase [Bacteroidales bacterium]|nr:N-acetylmuramoyl-L-alanine amidase [Bacteroidales bacterium]